MSTADYPVTAGDIYSLYYIAGTTAVSYTIPVDASYKIRVSNLALIDVSGKTFLELKQQVENIVTKNYPLSGVQFSLVTPSTFTVIVKGEVNQTEAVNAWPLSRLSFILTDLLTDYASMRDIVITSATGRSRTYDLFRALRLGDLTQDPYVRPGDIITVNKATRMITIDGEITRPGTYVLLESENLYDLIYTFAGGFTTAADPDSIVIERKTGGISKAGEKLYLDHTSVSSNFVLQHADTITVPSIEDSRPVMTIEGIVAPSVTSDGTEYSNSSKLSVPFLEG
jgi:protein involved in polysaccharide export with SLBB domain